MFRVPLLPQYLLPNASVKQKLLMSWDAQRNMLVRAAGQGLHTSMLLAEQQVGVRTRVVIHSLINECTMNGWCRQ